MTVQLLTYAKVASGLVVHGAALRDHDPKVDLYLLAALTQLRKRAQQSDSPPAHFTSDQAELDFEALLTGTNDEFLEAAEQLTRQLVSKMDGRAVPGLFVCMRASVNGTLSAVTLKLEVVTENAARLIEQVDSGELTLAAVANVVDAPGKLQKGAVYPDPRDGSDVCIGENLSVESLYFPQALGIRKSEKSNFTAARLVAAVHGRAPAAAAFVAAQLPTTPAGTPLAVLQAIAEQVPQLTPEVIQDVVSDLADGNRPVTSITPTAQLKVVYNLGGITVTASASEQGRISIEMVPGHGWQVLIKADDQPKVEYKS